jgi:hypothetical protein
MDIYVLKTPVDLSSKESDRDAEVDSFYKFKRQWQEASVCLMVLQFDIYD